MSRKTKDFPEIEKSVKAMLAAADSFEERKQAIEVALKFESLKLKARGNDFGKGFEEGDDDDSF